MYSHLTKEQIKKADTANVNNSLNIIQESATDMVGKLNDIVWLINPAKDSLQQLINRLEEYAIKMAAIKDIEVNVKLMDKIDDKVLHAETRRNIYLFCKEAINNAVKHSNASTLNFTVVQANSALQFTIADNGNGFNISEAPTGNGMDNMRTRAAQMNAELYIESANGKGTTLKLLVKIT